MQPRPHQHQPWCPAQPHASELSKAAIGCHRQMRLQMQCKKNNKFRFLTGLHWSSHHFSPLDRISPLELFRTARASIKTGCKHLVPHSYNHNCWEVSSRFCGQGMKRTLEMELMPPPTSERAISSVERQIFESGVLLCLHVLRVGWNHHIPSTQDLISLLMSALG